MIKFNELNFVYSRNNLGLSPVHNKDEVQLVLNKLKENKKIANATHNMYAYR